MNLLNKTKAHVRLRQAFYVLDDARYSYWLRHWNKAIDGTHLAFKLLLELEELYGKGLSEEPYYEQTTEEDIPFEDGITVERDEAGYLIR